MAQTDTHSVFNQQRHSNSESPQSNAEITTHVESGAYRETKTDESAADAVEILRLSKPNGRVSLLDLAMRGLTIPRVLAAWPVLERSGIQVYRNASHLWVQTPHQRQLRRRLTFDNRVLAKARKAVS